MIQKIKPGKRTGNVKIPASKSDAQRAILSAVLTKGMSRVKCVGSSSDVRSMIGMAAQFGATLNAEDGNLIISGAAQLPKKGCFNPHESGLGLRMLLAVLAVIGGDFTIEAEGSLLNRDQGFILEFLSKNGMKIESDNNRPPFRISGKLDGKSFTLDGSMSSQFLSGLLIGFPLSENKQTVLHVKELKSVPYVNMTLDTLRKFGVSVSNKDHKKYTIPGNQTYQVTDYEVEGDWSAASYWLVAAALGHDINVLGLNPNSFQADRAIISALYESGCIIDLDDKWIRVNGTSRLPLDFDATHCPDLFPALAVYAAFTPGVSSIKGVSRLANKESDRAHVIKSELQKMGVLVELKDDYMLIHGGEAHSATIHSHNDHRIAMAFAIAGTMVKEGVQIENAEAVEKSYPEFWKDLSQLN